MDSFMDRLWLMIETKVASFALFLDGLISPLEILGPGTVVFLLAFFAVGLSAVLRRCYTTRRHRELKEKFDYWYNLRQEALALEDGEKGRGLAKNIDQAELNRVYYDYFFEGFLKSLVTVWLPIFLTLAYVNRSYSPEGLIGRFGTDHLFFLVNTPALSVEINAVTWFFASLLLSFLVQTGLGRAWKRCNRSTLAGEPAC
jgi:hypothetical protein